MTVREVLDAVADELGMSFVSRPFSDRALLDLVIEETRGIKSNLDTWEFPCPGCPGLIR